MPAKIRKSVEAESQARARSATKQAMAIPENASDHVPGLGPLASRVVSASCIDEVSYRSLGFCRAVHGREGPEA
jgi:hypothetical protein